MIVVTGDTHIPIDAEKLVGAHSPLLSRLTKEDYLIVCGDFGGVWNGSTEENLYLDLLNDMNYSLLFVDGNHENFDLLNTYPSKRWKGGMVGEIRPTVFHLKRGYVFSIDGLRIFTFGGAYSIDKPYRKESISWWKEELPSKTEIERALGNLETIGNRVDYIITHTAPRDILRDVFGYGYIEDEQELLSLFEFLKNECDFKHWYFGHVHKDIKIDNRFTALYNTMVCMEQP